MLDAALKLAAQGFNVFPCKPRSKEPAGWLVPRGFHNATCNSATIRRWFGNDQQYNIGVRTGIASRLLVLDLDDEEAARRLVAEHGPLPLTRQSMSSRGAHYWFRIDTEVSGRKLDGADIKADGGYVVAPPSIHPDGPTYRWMNDEPLIPPPEWLIELARKPNPKPISERALDGVQHPRTHNGSPGAYGASALKYEIDDLANTPPGSRNHRLNRASFSLFQLVAGNELDGNEVEHRLFEAAERNGLVKEDGARAVRATIRSGARAGLQCPRSRGAR
jgi:hypothetical protein